MKEFVILEPSSGYQKVFPDLVAVCNRDAGCCVTGLTKSGLGRRSDRQGSTRLLAAIGIAAVT